MSENETQILQHSSEKTSEKEVQTGFGTIRGNSIDASSSDAVSNSANNENPAVDALKNYNSPEFTNPNVESDTPVGGQETIEAVEEEQVVSESADLTKNDDRGITVINSSEDSPGSPPNSTEDRSSWETLSAERIVTEKLGADYEIVLKDFKLANPGAEHWMEKWLKKSIIEYNWNPGDPIPDIYAIIVTEHPATGEPVIEAFSYSDARRKAKEIGVVDFETYYWKHKISGTLEYFTKGYTTPEVYFNQKRFIYTDFKTLVDKIYSVSGDYSLYQQVLASGKIDEEFVAFVKSAQEVLFYNNMTEWDGMLGDTSESEMDKWLLLYNDTLSRKIQSIYAHALADQTRFATEKAEVMSGFEQQPVVVELKKEGAENWAASQYFQSTPGLPTYNTQQQSSFNGKTILGNYSSTYSSENNKTNYNDYYEGQNFTLDQSNSFSSNAPLWDQEGAYEFDNDEVEYNNLLHQRNYELYLLWGKYPENIDDANVLFEYVKSYFPWESLTQTEKDVYNKKSDESGFLSSHPDRGRTTYETQMVLLLKEKIMEVKTNLLEREISTGLSEQKTYNPDDRINATNQQMFNYRKQLAEQLGFFKDDAIEADYNDPESPKYTGRTPYYNMPGKKMYNAWVAMLRFVRIPTETDETAPILEHYATEEMVATYQNFYMALKAASEDDFAQIYLLTDTEKELLAYNSTTDNTSQNLLFKFEFAQKAMDRILIALMRADTGNDFLLFEPATNLENAEKSIKYQTERKEKYKDYVRLPCMFYPGKDQYEHIARQRPDVMDELNANDGGVELEVYYKKVNGEYELVIPLDPDNPEEPSGATLAEALDAITDDLPVGLIYYLEPGTDIRKELITTGPSELTQWLAIGGLILCLVGAFFTGGASLGGIGSIMVTLGHGLFITASAITLAQLYEDGQLNSTLAFLEMANLAADLIGIGQLARLAKGGSLALDIAKTNPSRYVALNKGLLVKTGDLYIGGVIMANGIYFSNNALEQLSNAKNDEERDHLLMVLMFTGLITVLGVRIVSKTLDATSTYNKTTSGANTIDHTAGSTPTTGAKKGGVGIEVKLLRRILISKHHQKAQYLQSRN